MRRDVRVVLVLALLAGLFVPPADGQIANFATRHDIPALTSSLVVVDTNGDGIPDIVANDMEYGPGPAQICVYFGNGNGTFRDGPCTALSLPHDYFAIYIATADFNHDGKPDIAFVSGEPSEQVPCSIYVVFGNGDGTFGSQIQVTPTATGIFGGLIATDLDGDGNADIALNAYSGVVVVPGNGDGTFGKPVASTWPAEYGGGLALTAGDLQGDGVLDLIAGTATGLAVLENRGSWRYRMMSFVSAGKQVNSVVLGRLTKGGNLDLVMDCYESNEVLVALGEGGGKFGTPSGFAVAGGGGPLAVGDVNEDGNLDVVVSLLGSATVLLGNGKGSLQPSATYPVSLTGGNSSLVSLRGGGGPLDYVVAGGDGTICVLVNLGRGKFFDDIFYDVGASFQTATADFNGDGNPDLAFLTSGGVQVLFGTGKAGAPFAKGPLTPLSIPMLTGYIVAADFNLDGKMDVAVAAGNYESGAVYVLPGNGSGTFGQPIETAITVDDGYPPLQMLVTDFNHDGIPDIATTPVLMGNGDGTFTQGFIPTYGGLTLANFFAVGDLNHDGNQDLVACLGDSRPEIVAFLGNGSGTFGEGIPYYGLGNDYPGNCVLADFNGDGFLDIGYAKTTSGAGIILGNGDGTFQSPPTTYSSPDWYSTFGAAMADFTGDGKPDLVIGVPFNNTLGFLQNDGSGTMTILPFEFGVDSSPSFITVGSFHGDPKHLDMAVSNSDGSIAILINTTK